MGMVRRRVLQLKENGRAVARGAASAGALPAVLLLTGALAAVPAGAGDRSAAPSMPVRLEALDTSRPPVGGNWVVLAAAADASWRHQGGDRWRDFQQGQVLMPGSEIETGPGGEVILVVGGDQVRIAPSTRLVLPAVAGDGQRLHHERGRLRVDVEPRPGRAFEVTTPLLSLGIKGTSFETAVDQAQDRVVVLDGEVEARPVGRDDSFRLNEGQGLRQPAGPGAAPLRFELPVTPAGQAPEAATTWHLQSEAGAGLQDGRAIGTSDDAMSGPAGRSEHHNRPAARTPAARSSWAEDSTSLLIVGALAAAVVLLLAGPVMALCHNLFEPRLGGPATGRRRRELTRS